MAASAGMRRVRRFLQPATSTILFYRLTGHPDAHRVRAEIFGIVEQQIVEQFPAWANRLTAEVSKRREGLFKDIGRGGGHQVLW